MTTFNDFINQHLSTFKATKNTSLNVTPIAGQKSHGTIKVDKGDVVKVSDQQRDSLVFTHNNTKYQIGWKAFTSVFKLVR